jgi:two-component system, cell cycle sensor histidine kinase and response regulator CckA
MESLPSRAALRIAAVYTAVSAGWILLSDRALALAVDDAGLLTTLQTAKGWAFVAASALLLFVLVDREMRRRTESEARLAESEHLYRTLVEQPLAGVYVLDEGGLAYVNPRFEEIFGYAPGELADRASLELLVAPDDRDLVRSQILAKLRGEAGSTRYTFRGLRRNGDVIHLEANGARIDRNDRPAVVGMLQDVTQRRLVDQRRQQAQKMEAVGRLAGGIAHDFNNLLTAITGCAELIRGGLETGEDPAEDLDEIQKTARRGAALTRQLLAFSRREEGEPRVVALNDVVGGMEGILQRLLLRSVDVALELDPGAGNVLVDPDQLEQVLLNLAVNAQDAMESGGKVTIRTRSGPDTPGDHEGAEDLAILEVVDTGEGIAAELLPRIFEPFFSTKAPGRGTGLGLSTVHSIVSRAGGRVEVDSLPGVGTTFRVLLPRTGARAEAAHGQAGRAAAPVNGRGTILLVEDEPGVRRVSQRVLERAGCEVLTAATLRSALEVLEAFPRPIHLLIADASVLGPGQGERVQEFRQRRPHLKILLSSAGGGPRSAEGEEVHLLPKPFTPEGLTRRVKEILAGASSSDRRSAVL